MGTSTASPASDRSTARRFNVPAVARTDEGRADQKQDDIRLIQLLADLSIPILSRQELSVMPGSNALLSLQRPQRLSHTILPGLILVRTREEHARG